MVPDPVLCPQLRRLWRFVCLDKYGLTLTNICLDAWDWLLVWLFRGAEGACIFLFLAVWKSLEGFVGTYS